MCTMCMQYLWWPEEGVESLDLELKVMWMQETESIPYARTDALNCQSTTPATNILFSFYERNSRFSL